MRLLKNVSQQVCGWQSGHVQHVLRTRCCEDRTRCMHAGACMQEACMYDATPLSAESQGAFGFIS
eukprot:3136681-Pleurochrysis_carterae.AAC.1